MVIVTTFVVSLLIGGLGIYVGARLVVGSADHVNAIVTGLLGAVVLIVGGLFLGWIPLLGPMLVFVVYTYMVNRRYPGGWGNAARIALVAWLVTATVLVALAALGITTFEALGVPER